jgi:S1-C subfamily serine protease
LGLEVENADKLSDVERQLFGVDTGAKGPVVTDVVPGTPADEAQLSRGLRIVRLRVSGQAWQPITNKAAYTRIEKTLPAGAHVLMQLRDDKDVSTYRVIVVPGGNNTA